jgi:aspartate aminotransferase
MLAKRVKKIKPSPTLAVSAKIKAMKAQGIDVVGFGAGEPDFDTPDNIKAKAIDAINSGFTKYCPVEGIPDLKEAIVEKLKRELGLEYKTSEVIVSCGAKHSIYNALMSLVDEGDEVLIPAPYWVSYPDMVLLCGGKPKIIKTKEVEGFKLDPDKLKRAITPKTKVIIINSPSNPAGVTYTKEELEDIGNVLLKYKKVFIISDDIYEKLIYDGVKFSNIVQACPELKERTIVVNGVSKTYSMTGWRIGYALGPKPIIDAMINIQSQSTSNPTSISMKAAVEALKGPQEAVENMRKEFEARRNLIVDSLNAIEGVKCFKPMGAFYVFPNISCSFGKKTPSKKLIDSSLSFSEALLEEVKVGVVPGAEFGAEGYIRLSYATSRENIKKGLERIKEFIASLK